MTIFVEGGNSLFLATTAEVLGDRAYDIAWAEKHVRHNPALGWLLAKYVEADRPNQNNQFWTLADLRDSNPTIAHGPLNIWHERNAIIGTLVASELVYPTEQADDGPAHAYVETLGAIWRYYFPQAYQKVREAYDMGQLFISMECVSDTLTCEGDEGCGETFKYDGVQSATYCEHLQSGTGIRRMNKPHFLGGGLIFPPKRPGWNGAEVKDLAEYIKQHQSEAEGIHEAVAEAAPDLDPEQWEATMLQLMDQARKWKSTTPKKKMPSKAVVEEYDYARQFSTEKRKQMAKSGSALPDGSFPIATAVDLKNAIRAIGRANPEDRARVRAHIRKRAKALGLSNLIPEAWG